MTARRKHHHYPKLLRRLLCIGSVLLPQITLAAFGNYNSVLLGDRASGMGGAFTAMTGDPAASAYYNPATIARSQGRSLSTAASLFNKYDTVYGNDQNYEEAPLQINKGQIFSVPAASGIVQSFRNFAFALSIVMPSFEDFGGVIRVDGDNSTNLNIQDESIWVGGGFAFNSDEKEAWGITAYYTSRNYSRSLTDRYHNGSETIVTNEEKSFHNNSLVYVLGYYRKLSSNWSAGFSHRFPSIEISSKGDYQRSKIGTVSGADPLISATDLDAETKVPQKTTVGLSYEETKKRAYSVDLTYHSPVSYLDMAKYGDYVKHEATWNLNLGAEWYWKSWLAIRGGLFTNLSSHPRINGTPSTRTGDHIDMWGFSTTAVLITTPNTNFSLGGYYTGGKGHSVEEIEGSLTRIEKSVQVFSFLVGTSFGF